MSDSWVRCLPCDMWVVLVWDGEKLTINPHGCKGKTPEVKSEDVLRLTRALRIEHLSLASDLGEGYHYGECSICDLLKAVEQ